MAGIKHIREAGDPLKQQIMQRQMLRKKTPFAFGPGQLVDLGGLTLRG